MSIVCVLPTVKVGFPEVEKRTYRRLHKFIFFGGFILKNCNIFTDDLMKRTSLCYKEMSPADLCAEYILLKKCFDILNSDPLSNPSFECKCIDYLKTVIVLLVLLKKSVLHGIDLSACKQNLGGSPPAGYAAGGAPLLLL